MHRGRAGGRPALTARGRLALILYATAGTLYGLDRLTKALAEELLAGRAPVDLIPGVLRLRFTTNPGGAFGLFGGLTWLFVVISVAVALVVVAASFDLSSRVSAVALGLILGGAVGNLTDRIIRGEGFSGRVVDFLDFRVWPVFNVADAAIVVGVLLLLGGSLRRDRARER